MKKRDVNNCSLANSTFSNARHRAVHSMVMSYFSSPTYSVKKTIIKNFKRVTNFLRFCGLSDFLSQCLCYLVWIHCCKWPNSDFCISQSSVATLLMWGGLNYSHYIEFLCDVACQRLSKLFNVSQCFFLKMSPVFWDRVYNYHIVKTAIALLVRNMGAIKLGPNSVLLQQIGIQSGPEWHLFYSL